MGFYCNGKIGFCECDILCADCRHYDNTGGQRITTNADRIRAMGDEELAWELMTWRIETLARHDGAESDYPCSQSAILEWLKQPVEDNKCHF